jgi:uncharacterized membrane protein
MHLLTRSALVGAASGLRSQIGAGAVVLAGREDLPPALRSRKVRTAFALAVLGEIVTDKLPIAGSRLAPGPLAARVVLGGAAAGAMAWRRRADVLPAVLVAGAAALVAAKVGHDARAAAAKRAPDLVVALAEDALAVSLALTAVR